jgi:hypothetical protein
MQASAPSDMHAVKHMHKLSLLQVRSIKHAPPCCRPNHTHRAAVAQLLAAPLPVIEFVSGELAAWYRASRQAGRDLDNDHDDHGNTYGSIRDVSFPSVPVSSRIYLSAPVSTRTTMPTPIAAVAAPSTLSAVKAVADGPGRSWFRLLAPTLRMRRMNSGKTAWSSPIAAKNTPRLSQPAGSCGVCIASNVISERVPVI